MKRWLRIVISRHWCDVGRRHVGSAWHDRAHGCGAHVGASAVGLVVGEASLLGAGGESWRQSAAIIAEWHLGHHGGALVGVEATATATTAAAALRVCWSSGNWARVTSGHIGAGRGHRLASVVWGVLWLLLRRLSHVHEALYFDGLVCREQIGWGNVAHEMLLFFGNI